jgi:ribosome recycling factor
MFLRLAKSMKISFNSQLSFRFFSKKGKQGKGKETKNELPEFDFDIENLKKDFDSSIKSFENSLQKITVGRGDPRILDKVYVQGLHCELSSIAQVVPKNANELLIKPFDLENIEPILSALNSSNMRFQYRKEGNSTIQVIIPKPTQEYKAQLVKQAKDFCEETKQNIRKKRQNSLNSLKDVKEIGEDDVKKIKNDVQKLTDKYTEMIEKMLKDKEKSLNS